MKITETGFPGLKIIEPKVFEDSRGYFFESFNFEKFNDAGLNFNFLQDNQSKSQYGVIRGLHYQRNPYTQAKLIRVLQGSIYDVVVDLRSNSPSFGQWYGLDISESNRFQLLVPRGFAHGISVLTEFAVVLYKCDQVYNSQAEAGIRYNDPVLRIDWRIPPGREIISAKDSMLPEFNSDGTNPIFEY